MKVTANDKNVIVMSCATFRMVLSCFNCLQSSSEKEENDGDDINCYWNEDVNKNLRVEQCIKRR